MHLQHTNETAVSGALRPRRHLQGGSPALACRWLSNLHDRLGQGIQMSLLCAVSTMMKGTKSSVTLHEILEILFWVTLKGILSEIRWVTFLRNLNFWQIRVEEWPNHFQESADSHGLGGTRSRIAVPGGSRRRGWSPRWKLNGKLNVRENEN